jgi:hypothetical protein
MEISVVFHRFYRKFFEDTYENVIYQFDLSRETLPFRASIRDFDLDPPLTYKGLKDSYHTGK